MLKSISKWNAFSHKVSAEQVKYRIFRENCRISGEKHTRQRISSSSINKVGNIGMCRTKGTSNATNKRKIDSYRRRAAHSMQWALIQHMANIKYWKSACATVANDCAHTIHMRNTRSVLLSRVEVSIVFFSAGLGWCSLVTLFRPPLLFRLVFRSSAKSTAFHQFLPAIWWLVYFYVVVISNSPLYITGGARTPNEKNACSTLYLFDRK